MWLIVPLIGIEKEFNSIEKKLCFLGLHCLVEAVLFCAIAYLFIDSPKTFYFCFFGLQAYRILLLVFIRLYRLT